MSLTIRHRGQVLTKQQLELLNPILIDYMNGENGLTSKKKMESVIDKAFKEAGCPLPDEPSKGSETCMCQ